MASTMKAWVQTGFGGPETRVLQEVPVPRPGAGEVLVKVAFCALNRLDILQRRARLIPVMAPPHIAGMDFAGEVVAAAGPEGAALVGRQVVVDPVVTCGVCDRCRAGLAVYCRQFRTCGSSRAGGLAEYVAVPAANCIVVDGAAARLAELACVPVASVTAWHGLLGAGGLQPGETVVVPGAGSGLGIAGIQIARARGCRVITTVAGPAKLAQAAALAHGEGVGAVVLAEDGA